MKTSTVLRINFLSTPFKSRLGPAGLAFQAALALTLVGLACAEDHSARIPFSAIGAKATADYQGNALRVAATPGGARLGCGFQKLEGRATAQGLCLESTALGGGELRLVATAVHREVLGPQSMMLTPWSPLLSVANDGVLPTSGIVSVEDKLVRFARPGVTEEYSVSVAGVRQDFVITERPIGGGN